MKPHWAKRAKKYIAPAWKIAGITFAIVFVVAFVHSSYSLYQGLYLEDQANLAQMYNEVDVLTSKVLILAKAGSTPYSEQMPTQINSENILFSSTGAVVHDRIFNNCDLFLIQNYLYIRDCTIVNCSAKGTTGFYVTSMNTMPEGIVTVFIDCVFDGCWFVDANIIGDETEIAYCKTNIK